MRIILSILGFKLQKREKLMSVNEANIETLVGSANIASPNTKDGVLTFGDAKQQPQGKLGEYQFILNCTIF